MRRCLGYGQGETLGTVGIARGGSGGPGPGSEGRLDAGCGHCGTVTSPFLLHRTPIISILIFVFRRYSKSIIMQEFM